MTLAQAQAAGTPVAPMRRNAEGVDPGRKRDEAVSDTGEQSRWMPSMRTLTIAALLGATAGTIAALWVTVAQGLGL